MAARELARHWGVEVTPVIGATPGYTSVQALQTLEDVGARVQPDIVVIATLWSDLFQTDVPVERSGGQSHPSALYRVSVRLLSPWLPAPTVGWTEGDVGAEKLGRTARVGLDRFTRTLNDLVAKTKQLGGQPVILILPAPIDLDREPTPGLIAAYRGALKQVAAKHVLMVVDGPAVFKKNGASNREFFDQVHPSVSGHRWLGEALAEALASQDAAK